MSILSFNAGSSTLKFAVFDDATHDELAAGLVDWRGGTGAAELTLRSASLGERKFQRNDLDYGAAVEWTMNVLNDIGLKDAIRIVGHRVVHGGTEFRQATRIDEHVRQGLERVSLLAPLHNPAALAVIAAARSAILAAEHVAVFDTAFFADLPPHRVVYPVPYEWFEKFGVRRYGFHGISHAYSANRAAELLNRVNDASLRLVICHLGNGCSATAVLGGKAIATTMGFTPLEGLMMGARCGSIDPSILLYMLREQHVSAEDLDSILNRKSGLLGVSGVSSDFREVEKTAEACDDHARLALDMFADRVRSTIGSLAVTLGGLDALVFTAGIGEHAAKLRKAACENLGCLGAHLCDDQNQSAKADCDVARAESLARILVIAAREELMIAREAKRLLHS